MYRLAEKLRILKKCIRKFSRENYSELEKRVEEAHRKLLLRQNETLRNPTAINAEIELTAQLKWQELADAEQSFLLQRSRVLWAGNGDAGTAYFHRMVATRKALNHIHHLSDVAGNTYTSHDEIEAHCVEYFSVLLGGASEPQMFTQEDLTLLFDFTCSQEDQKLFVAGFSAQEIKDVFFSLPRNKTSGPDGYSSEFFISCWQIVGPEVVEAVQEFFKSGSMLRQWNATTLVLIPKITNASSTSDFRPISCLNTVYKVVSKLISNRLKAVLPSVISQAQSAFLPGRLLAENVLLATDLVKGYNSSTSESKAMLKVDLRKAFDSIRWDFILGILKAMSVPDIFINWISQCISTASFSVSVNGASGGFFSSTKGIRQGDPMSPYLFVLAMEGLTRLLQSRYVSGSIGYHPRTSELKITHLMFADDVMIFFDGRSDSLHGISECLEDFASWSGLVMNRNKTELYSAGLDLSETNALVAYGFPTGTLPVRYLGLPLMSRKLRISEYEPLITRITSRFQSWSVKALSFAGRLQLIGSVIYGTVNFWMSTFILPKGCLKRIESLCSRFLWSGNTEVTGKAKVSWYNVCMPKAEGGLGLRNLLVWNRVLCLRFVWLLFSDSASLWAQWHRHHHTNNQSFWALEESDSDSWTWRQLLKLRAEGIRFIKPILGSGHKISFWYDTWTPLGQLINFIGLRGPSQLRIHINSTVADACSPTGWLLPSPRSDQALELHVYLTAIPCPAFSEALDSYVWNTSTRDECRFSARNTWEDMRPSLPPEPAADVVWFKGAIPRNSFTMWVANMDRLPTRSRLASWGLQINTSCCLCSAREESRDHLFLSCDYSSEVWRLSIATLNPPRDLFCSWSELLSWIRSTSISAPTLLRKLVAQCTIYHLWKQRNNVLHNQFTQAPSMIYRLIDRDMRNTITARRSRKQFQNLMAKWMH